MRNFRMCVYAGKTLCDFIENPLSVGRRRCISASISPISAHSESNIFLYLRIIPSKGQLFSTYLNIVAGVHMQREREMQKRGLVISTRTGLYKNKKIYSITYKRAKQIYIYWNFPLVSSSNSFYLYTYNTSGAFLIVVRAPFSLFFSYTLYYALAIAPRAVTSFVGMKLSRGRDLCQSFPNKVRENIFEHLAESNARALLAT